MLVNKKIRKDNTIETTLKEVFDYFYCFNADISVVSTLNTILIKFKRRGIPLRYERQKFNIEMGDHSLTSTDYDDYKNWIKSKNNYITDMNATINNNFTPKVKCYNYGNTERGENEKLRHYITTYFSEENQMNLLDKLDTITETEIKRQVKVDRTTAEDIWNSMKGNQNNFLKNTPLLLEEGNENDILYGKYDSVEGEVFKNLEQDYYKISNFGRILYNKDINNLRILKTYCLDIPLSKERINETFKLIGSKYDKDIKNKINCVIINGVFYFVERLVAEAFVETYRADYHIKHLNNDYKDDRADNLFMCEEWSKRQYGDIINEIKTNKKQATKDKIKLQRATEKFTCENCNKEMLKVNKAKHLKNCKKSGEGNPL